MSYEYKVVPAPVRGVKAKGVKTAEDRFANALETAMNTLAADGWEYLRADTLPCEQREGLMGKTTVYQNMLVFRRAKGTVKVGQRPQQPPVTAPRPVVQAAPVAAPQTVAAPAPAKTAGDAPAAKPDSSPEVAAE